MAALRHLGFLKYEILTASPIRGANVRHNAKLCVDRSNSCEHMTIFSERELTFTFAICYRPSVCRLSSLTFVRPT